MIGKLTDISKSLQGRFRVTFEVDAIDELNGMEDKELTVRVTRKANKRSLNANAYFHVLVDKIAEKLNVSHFEIHNRMIARYGYIDEGVKTIIMLDTIPYEKLEVLHLRPTTSTRILDDGRLYRVFFVMRGSHTYNTIEMTRLIDGTVSEAKELGIETLTPAELERMMSAWSQSYKKSENVTSAEQQSDWSAIM